MKKTAGKKEKALPGNAGVTEELNTWIRIIRPGLLLLGVSQLLVAMAVLVWGFTGTLPVSETLGAYVVPDAEAGQEVLCFMDAIRFPAASLAGNEARITMGDGSICQGTVQFCSEGPKSATDYQADYEIPGCMISRLMTSDYLYVIGIQPEEPVERFKGQLATVSVVVREVRPISFLMR